MVAPGNDLRQKSPGESTPADPRPHTDPTPLHHDWRWVPVRSLAPRHRERIAAHLIGLPNTDRYLRFGYPATDAQISKYVDMLDFEHDEVFGVFNRRLVLVALAHLAHPGFEPSGRRQDIAEFGVSVLPHARGRGFGHRLFEHAMLHARNRGVQRLMVQTLSENAAMLRIAKTAGARVERDGPESQALLALPPDSIGSHVGELLEGQAAELDYQFKRGARKVAGLLGVIADVKTQIAKAAHSVED
jgi:GNAT superfamily N-acetyltransferase